MELRHLRYFVAVAEELSFRRAAERLHIAQPPLTVQIHKLEQEIGAKLFSRARRKVALTDAGCIFLEQARQTLAQVNQAAVLARQASKGESAHLSVGCGTAAEFRIFPSLIPAFMKSYPDIRLDFHNMRTPQLLERLERDELDVVFPWLPVAEESFQIQPLAHEHFLAALPTQHELACAEHASIKALSNIPLVLFSRALDPELFHEIQQLFSQVGAVMNVAYEVNSLVSVLTFVAMGVGCSVLPEYIRELPRAGIVLKELQGPRLVKTVGMVKKADKGGLAEIFYQFTLSNFQVAGL